MITHKIGDALLISKGIIVHGCNAQGVMSAGFAKSIKTLYPSAFKIYRDSYEKGDLILGSCTVAKTTQDFYIVNGVTQQYYGRQSGVRYVNYEAVKSVFSYAEKLALATNLPLVFPLIGCGLAGGDWETVESIINTTVSDKVQKILYTPE